MSRAATIAVWSLAAAVGLLDLVLWIVLELRS